MKKYLTLIATALFVLNSCSKKNDLENQSVTINGIDYPTITIGNQIWTSVNYRGPGGKDAPTTVDGNTYGKYYGARDIADIKLPAGWRIPSKTDYDALLKPLPESIIEDLVSMSNQAASDALRSKSGWTKGTQGNNSTKFNGLPAGYFNDEYSAEAYHEIGEEAIFITTTPTPYPGNLGNYVLFLSATYQTHYNQYKDVRCGVATRIGYGDGYSLRFVKDK
jgi:uncharacterized protein (TIGR02145 family)